MKRLHGDMDDFEAVIRIHTPEQGERKSPAYKGLRWDFAYADDPPAKDLFVIHPDFYDKHGDSLSSDRPLSTGVELAARMVILNEDMCQQGHRLWIREGVRFYCHEGPHRVAEGQITHTTGLFSKG